MSKRARSKPRDTSATDVGAVGPRQPCPCGSGRRYKSCHGSPSGPAPRLVTRPFHRLRAECDIVAMRELVPAATAPLPLLESVGTGRNVVLCTLLPVAAPAMIRQDGTVWLGLQVQHGFGDPSRDLAAVLLDALEAEPGTIVGLTEAPGDGPRLQDVLVDEPLSVTVHSGFEFWLADVADPDGSAAASLQQANAAAHPTTRLSAVESAYWTDVGPKEHLRWVLPHAEGPLLDALARLHVAGVDTLVEGGRLVGMFRAHGLLVPVWDLPLGTGAAAREQPVAALRAALDRALADEAPLTAEERAGRNGLANRQVTIR